MACLQHPFLSVLNGTIKHWFVFTTPVFLGVTRFVHNTFANHPRGAFEIKGPVSYSPWGKASNGFWQ